jgi:ATP-dependent Clp protease ATP-binding subunit ClpC
MQNMADRFEKFTERARTVLSLAQEEAIRLQHNYIGTEHLLLGLVREGNGLAAKVLTNMGVDLDTIRCDVEAIIGRGNRIVKGEIGLTPRAKKVIELAMDEARRMNHHYIGTEHLLLGLIREGTGIAAGVLEQEGLRLGEIRRQVMQAVYNSPNLQNPVKRAMPFVVVSAIIGANGLILAALWRKLAKHR